MQNWGPMHLWHSLSPFPVGLLIWQMHIKGLEPELRKWHFTNFTGAKTKMLP